MQIGTGIVEFIKTDTRKQLKLRRLREYGTIQNRIYRIYGRKQRPEIWGFYIEERQKIPVFYERRRLCDRRAADAAGRILCESDS